MTPDVSLRRVRADREPAAGLLAAMAVELDELYADLDGDLHSVPATPEQMWEPQGSFLVLSEGDLAVGCGGVKQLDPATATAEIKRMYVLPTARGRGHAKRMLAELESEARRLGYQRIRLDTGPGQPAARNIYERAGYRAIPPYNENPYAAHWFERELDEEPG